MQSEFYLGYTEVAKRKRLTKEEIEQLDNILGSEGIDDEDDEEEFMGRKFTRLDVDIRRSDSQYHGTTWHDDI